MIARLKQLRNQKDLSQENVASILGVSQQTISRYEKDIYTMPMDMLIRFAKYYGVSTDYLLGMTEQKMKFDPDGEKVEEKEEFFAMYLALGQEERRLIWELMKKLGKN